MILRLLCFKLLTCFLLVTTPAHSVTWVASGPGSTNISVVGNVVTFTYSLDVERSFGTHEWVLTGKNFLPDTHVFDWVYSGEHDRAQNATYLRAPDHLLVEPRDGRGAFSYSGQGMTIINPKKDNFRFVMRATNDDTNNILAGSLQLAMVPLPASMWAGLIGFSALGVFGRNRRRRGGNSSTVPVLN